MSKKMYWGLAVLIVIFIAGGVFWFINDHSEMQQLQKELTEATKMLEDRQKQQQGVDNKPPRAAKDGHKWDWQGDHWDEIPVAQRLINTSENRILTKEQISEVKKFWKDLGLKPPPKGYGYEWGENGTATLFQFNVPRFEVKWSKKASPGADYYKLTDEEWDRHNVLVTIINGSHFRLDQEQLTLIYEGKSVPKAEYAHGVVELAREWVAELKQKASGPLPTVSTDVMWTRQPTERELQEIERKEYELLNSLSKPTRPSLMPTDQNYIAEIISNLEAEVQRRKQ